MQRKFVTPHPSPFLIRLLQQHREQASRHWINASGTRRPEFEILISKPFSRTLVLAETSLLETEGGLA